jgi:hypothetical protein
VVPVEFSNFFLGSAGAAAALIGLLFVAISIAPEHTVFESAPVERQGVASTTFSALTNAFFISIAALIPGANLGYTTLAMSVIALSNNLNVGWNLLKRRQNWQEFIRGIVMVLVGLVLYGYELYLAWQLLFSPKQANFVFDLSTLLLGIYGLALIRAWELLGARRFALSYWLNPLRRVNQSLSSEQKDESNAEANALNTEISPEPANADSNQRPSPSSGQKLRQPER